MSSSSGERLQLWPQVHQLLLLLDCSQQEFSAVASIKPHFVSCCKCQVTQVLQPVKAVYAQLLQFRFSILPAPRTEYYQFCNNQDCQAAFVMSSTNHHTKHRMIRCAFCTTSNPHSCSNIDCACSPSASLSAADSHMHVCSMRKTPGTAFLLTLDSTHLFSGQDACFPCESMNHPT